MALTSAKSFAPRRHTPKEHSPGVASHGTAPRPVLRVFLKRAVLAGAALLWIAGLVFVSLHQVVPHAPQGSMLHPIEHVVAFGILGIMLLPLCRSRGPKLVVILAILGFACALEIGQHQLFRQPIEWWDVRDDGTGLLLALLLLRFTRIRALLVR
jgi:hypothetical protein